MPQKDLRTGYMTSKLSTPPCRKSLTNAMLHSISDPRFANDQTTINLCFRKEQLFGPPEADLFPLKNPSRLDLDLDRILHRKVDALSSHIPKFPTHHFKYTELDINQGTRQQQLPQMHIPCYVLPHLYHIPSINLFAV